MLARRHDFPRIFPYLGRILRIRRQKRGKAQDRVHGRADVVGHVGEEHGLGIAGYLGGLEGLGQLLVVNRPLLLPLLADFVLLPPVQVIQKDAQKECRQHSRHDDEKVLVHRLPLLLDGLHRHIAHQENRAVIYRPHIDEGPDPPDIVVEQDIFPALQALLHIGLDPRIADVVSPVEIVQVQMARAALPHALGLEDEALALRVHDIQRGLFPIEAVGQGFIDGIVYIFHIERPYLLSLSLHGAFHGIGPCPHVVQVGLGDLHSRHGPAGSKIQPLLREGFPGAGDALRLSGRNQ